MINLDDAQRATVSKWVEEGLKLSDIQKKLASELGLSLTYMDVRFLIDDLKLKLKDVEPPKPPTPILPAAAPSAPTEPSPLTPEPEQKTGPGGVSVIVDQVARPGALVSGRVTFSDGKKAEWYLDEMGRLGLAPVEKGYRPSQQDVMEFQTALQNQLARMGF